MREKALELLWAIFELEKKYEVLAKKSSLRRATPSGNRPRVGD